MFTAFTNVAIFSVVMELLGVEKNSLERWSLGKILPAIDGTVAPVGLPIGHLLLHFSVSMKWE